MITRHAGIVALALSVGAPAAAFAANANHPYQNVDPRNDAGNPTGDAETDRLNQAQLGQTGGTARPGSWWTGSQGAPRGYGQTYRPSGPGYGGGLRGPGYYPPPGYGGPAGYGAPPPGYYSPPQSAYVRPSGPPPGYPY